MYSRFAWQRLVLFPIQVFTFFLVSRWKFPRKNEHFQQDFRLQLIYLYRPLSSLYLKWIIANVSNQGVQINMLCVENLPVRHCEQTAWAVSNNILNTRNVIFGSVSKGRMFQSRNNLKKKRKRIFRRCIQKASLPDRVSNICCTWCEDLVSMR